MNAYPYIRWLFVLVFLEGFMVGSGLLIGRYIFYGYVQDMFAVGSGIQLMLLLLGLLVLWIYLRKDRFFTNRALNQSGRRAFAVGVPAVILFLALWVLLLFSLAEKAVLRAQCTSAAAEIRNFQLVEYSAASHGYVPADSIENADHLNLELVYAGHDTTVRVASTGRAFVTLFHAAYQKKPVVPVCYLAWEPGLVMPKAEL